MSNMKDKIALLREAAIKVGSSSLAEELTSIEQKMSSTDVPVMIPLVGEFSSGKTSLINALTDSKALEIATKPTTATIFEIHFGAPSNRAEVLREDGIIEEVTEISTLKNENLGEATVVTVFDTSKRVSPYTILVDTPGISSSDPKHKQVLVDFLPQSDALLLVVDINQQLTKSLSDFLKSVSLTGIELNVVLTKSDTKSQKEIQAAKEYFTENCEFSINKLVAVSASLGELDELYGLLKEIEIRKSEIIRKSITNRLKVISEKILSTIDTLLKASKEDASIAHEINEQEHKLRKIQGRIERFINSLSSDIEDVTRDCVRKFEDQVNSRLSGLINGKSQNYDAEAVATINSIASALVGDYRHKVMVLLSEKANLSNGSDEVSLAAVTGVDLSGINIHGLSYNLDLNSLGHEYDKWIKGGIIAVGAAAAAGAVVATGGAAVAAEGAMTVDLLADVADTASDVGSIISNRNTTRKIESVVKYGQQAADKYAAIDNVNSNGINQSGVGQGMIDSLVGFIAEKTMSKPQRARAVRVYVDDTLAPEFKMQLKNAERQIIETVKDVLSESARNTIEEITTQLKQLQQEMRNNKVAVEDHKTELRNLQTNILTL